MKKLGIIYFSCLVFISAAVFLSCNQSRIRMDFVDAWTAATSQPEIQHPDVPYISGIFSRKNIRNFDPAPVGKDQIDLITKAAFAAPTGGNQHSCEFIIVTERKLMQAMKKGNPYSQALDTAPLTLVIAANHNTAIYPELLSLDAGMAAQNVLIQASELGLSSVPMSIAPQEARIQGVSQALNLPEGVVPIIMISMGYPAADTVSAASTGFYDEKKIHHNNSF